MEKTREAGEAGEVGRVFLRVRSPVRTWRQRRQRTLLEAGEAAEAGVLLRLGRTASPN